MCPSLLLVLSVCVAAPGPKEKPKEPPSVVGEWVSEKAVVGGKAGAIPAGSTTFEFTADGHVQVREGGKKPDPADYTVNPKKSPAEIDVTLQDGVPPGPMLGIFKVDGDTLTLCLSIGGKRPAKFESPDGSTTMLLTLKRVAKKK